MSGALISLTVCADPFLESDDPSKRYELRPMDVAAFLVQVRCDCQAKELLRIKGMEVDEAGQLRLAKAVAAALQRASLILDRWARGDYGTADAINEVGVATPSSTAIASKAEALPFAKLIDGWAAEQRPTAKTQYEWRRVVKRFTNFIGFDDARRVSKDHVLGWKASMVDAGLRAKTIRDAQLAPVRAILRWGMENGLITVNPADGVSIDVKQKAGEGRRGFRDAEAIQILRAASTERNAVLRWVPLLCAYTGARVAEVCQLRREDVLQIDGRWCVKFDPAAGSLKNASSERIVPLHPAVQNGGFISFVESAAAGPLFSDLRPDKFGSRGGNGTKILGRWVRDLGLTDSRLGPNHSWRHRFKTVARQFGLATDIVDAIAGHARKSIGDRYGEFPVSALHRELIKLPDLLSSPPTELQNVEGEFRVELHTSAKDPKAAQSGSNS